jgi:hypothetical protein
MWEYWAIDKDGNKYHETVKTKSNRNSKVRAIIQTKVSFNIDECLDFGFRKLD